MLEAWLRALQIAQLLALDPHGFGGVLVRARAGPVRDRWLGFLQKTAQALDLEIPLKRMPHTIRDENLLGGLDLELTLQQGRPILRQGLLARCDRQLLVLPMAERLEKGIVARLASALDQGMIRVERDGQSALLNSRLGIVVLDEGTEDDDPINSKLLDRTAFHLDLEGLSWSRLPDESAGGDDDFLLDPSRIQEIRKRVSKMTLDDKQVEVLVTCAAQLGIDSLRAVLFTMRTAQYLAACDLDHQDDQIHPDHLQQAITLVLIPRATQLPNYQDEQNTDQSEDQNKDDDSKHDEADEQDQSELPELENAPAPEDRPLEDQVLEAIQANIPLDLLARLSQIALSRQKNSGAGKAGANQLGGNRGRPIGAMPGMPGAGNNLSLMDTLRAAVPWQKIRRAELMQKKQSDRLNLTPHVFIRKEDLRVRRYRQQTQTLTTFVVDASGSAALNRLAEAKGAVELLLAECYVRRDQVALIAFRGSTAELLLSPTRSLVRAKRSLSALPGGGGTPLALAIDCAFDLAKSTLKKGMTPTLVFLTDGRANIARDGLPGRAQAILDAEHAARLASPIRVRSLWIDTSPQAREEGRNIAGILGSYYLPLPYAGAQELSQAVIRAIKN